MSENSLYVDRIEEFAKLVCDRHPEHLATFKSIILSLMKEAMKENRGSINPRLMQDAIIKELSERK